MAKTTRSIMDLPAFIMYWLDQGETFEEIADENEITDIETGDRLRADELEVWYKNKEQIRRWYKENFQKR